MALNKAGMMITGEMINIFIGVGALIAVVLFMALFIPWLRDFRRELRYINMEIKRTEGREQAHWIKRKKRLKMSILPFFHY